jgi:beta-N-acetylhexosaminidase
LGCAVLASIGVLAAGRAAGSSPSLGQLVGQVVMGRMTGTTPSLSLLGRIRRGELGGIILFGDNVRSATQVRVLVTRLQQVALAGGNPPLLIAVDQEGGFVKRLPDGPPFESPAMMGRTGTVASVREIGRATGSYLHSVGISIDLAPVVDVPSSPASFLGSRAFGEDPSLVARLGTAFAQGVQQAGVAATAKHFPGLGTATGNTDAGRVVVWTSKRELLRRLTPFRAAIRGGVRLAMVSNALYPALDRTGLPAVLSQVIVTGLLRQQLGFGGVVISDWLGAPGPARFPDASVRALNAGVDVLLLSHGEGDSATGYEQLLQAARNGTLTRAILLTANARIAQLKHWLYRNH